MTKEPKKRPVGRPKKIRRKPPVILTEEEAKDLVETRVRNLDPRGRGAALAIKGMTDVERQYLRMMVDFFIQGVEDAGIYHGTPRRTEKRGSSHRYNPEEMWHNVKLYFKMSVEYAQPLTLTGLAVFNGISRQSMTITDIAKLPKEYSFMNSCVQFIEMYNEFAVHKKQNPAGPIFILKNFGWKDTFTVENILTPGALSEEERAKAQKRVAGFSEDKVKDAVVIIEPDGTKRTN